MRNKAIYLALGCCPTARVRASTHKDVLHLDKEEAFSQSPISHAAVASSPQLIAFGDDETQSSNGSQTSTWRSSGCPIEVTGAILFWVTISAFSTGRPVSMWLSPSGRYVS